MLIVNSTSGVGIQTFCTDGSGEVIVGDGTVQYTAAALTCSHIMVSADGADTPIQFSDLGSGVSITAATHPLVVKNGERLVLTVPPTEKFLASKGASGTLRIAYGVNN
jgi:hypothetical protein